MSLSLLVAPILLFVAILLFVLPVFARLLRHCHLSDVTPEWLESFSPSNYQAMESLLAEEDFNFLVRQPGFESSLARKLRRDRIEIFRQYLNRLVADFNRLHVYARYLTAQSKDDQSALLTRLIWLRVRFSYSVLRVEAGLLFSYFGFQPRVVSEVLAYLNEMNRCLHLISSTA